MAHVEAKQSKVNRTHLVLVLLAAVLILSVTRGRLVASMVHDPGRARCSVESCASPQ